VSATASEGHIFRPFIGALCVIGGLVAFGGLYFLEIPPGNRDALMLALANPRPTGRSRRRSASRRRSTGRSRSHRWR
jgi:hypothetical protein